MRDRLFLRICCQFALPLATLLVMLMLVSPVLRQAIINTLILGVGANAIAIPMGVTLGRLCAGAGILPRIAQISCLVFVFVPLFVQVSAWDSAFGKLGWWNAVSWSISNVALGNWLLAVWVHGIAATPMVSLLIWLGLLGAARIEQEQAALDATPTGVFWHIVLPRLMPLIVAAAVWVFITCAREIAVTDIYRIGTLAEFIYLGYSLGQNAELLGPGFAMSCMILIAAPLASIVFSSILNDLSSNELLFSRVPARNANISQSLFGLMVVLAMTVMPIVNLLTRASRYVELVESVPTPRHSFANLITIIGQVPELYVSEACWSVAIATVSSVVLMSLCVLLVWSSFESTTCQRITIALYLLACSLPGPVIGSALLGIRAWVSHAGVLYLFDRTIFAPVIANVIFCFPMATAIVWFVLRNTPKDIVEQAKIEGVGFRGRLTQLGVAGNAVGLIGAFLMTFAVCIGELSASQLAVPPGIDTLPRRMLGLLHSGVNDRTAGVTIVCSVLIFGVVGAGHLFLRWNRNLNRQ